MCGEPSARRTCSSRAAATCRSQLLADGAKRSARTERAARTEVERRGTAGEVAVRVAEGAVGPQRTERTGGPEIEEPGEQPLALSLHWKEQMGIGFIKLLTGLAEKCPQEKRKYPR